MGGREPNICQLVMDNPDLVRRVTPPTCTMAKTSEEVDNSHFPTVACGLSAGVDRSGKPAMEGEDDAMLCCQKKMVRCIGGGAIIIIIW